MKEWCIIFQYDPDPEHEPYFQNGLEINLARELKAIEDDQVGIPMIKGILREMPTPQAVPEYDFETYTVGVSKGYNYCLEDLKGLPHGTYDPSLSGKWLQTQRGLSNQVSLFSPHYGTYDPEQDDLHTH